MPRKGDPSHSSCCWNPLIRVQYHTDVCPCRLTEASKWIKSGPSGPLNSSCLLFHGPKNGAESRPKNWIVKIRPYRVRARRQACIFPMWPKSGPGGSVVWAQTDWQPDAFSFAVLWGNRGNGLCLGKGRGTPIWLRIPRASKDTTNSPRQNA